MFKKIFKVKYLNMKKFILLTIFIFSLILLDSPYSLSALSKSYDGTHTFYCSENFFCNDAQTTKNGNGYLICVNTKKAEKLKEQLKNNCQGESFCFVGDYQDLTSILKKLNAQTIKEETFDDFCVIYGFSPKLKSYIYIDNQKVNVQIALNKNKITVGSPLILGSF